MIECHQDEIGGLIKIIHDAWRRAGDTAMSEMDLTFSQFRVLGYLYARGEEKTAQRDIEDSLGVSHPTVAGILKRLEGKGYALAETDETDRRVKNVRLTEKTLRLYEEMERRRHVLSERMYQGLSETERAELSRMLSIVRANVSALHR